MIAVLWAAGLRRDELVALDLADFDQATGKLTVRNGKGRKARTVYIKNNGKKVLDAWLNLRGTAEGPLFWAIGRGGKRVGQRLTTQSVYNMLKLRARRPGWRISRHTISGVPSCRTCWIEVRTSRPWRRWPGSPM
jgi:integrase